MWFWYTSYLSTYKIYVLSLYNRVNVFTLPLPQFTLPLIGVVNIHSSRWRMVELLTYPWNRLIRNLLQSSIKQGVRCPFESGLLFIYKVHIGVLCVGLLVLRIGWNEFEPIFHKKNFKTILCTKLEFDMWNMSAEIVLGQVVGSFWLTLCKIRHARFWNKNIYHVETLVQSMQG